VYTALYAVSTSGAPSFEAYAFQTLFISFEAYAFQTLFISLSVSVGQTEDFHDV